MDRGEARGVGNLAGVAQHGDGGRDLVLRERIEGMGLCRPRQNHGDEEGGGRKAEGLR